MKVISFNSDAVGIVASTLCLIHCIATPFLFLAKACSVACCADAPVWWKLIDYIFIVISFIAIYFATKKSNKEWIKIALRVAWFVLLIGILEETFKINFLFAGFTYFPAISIVLLHFYNHKYCMCVSNNCCIK